MLSPKSFLEEECENILQSLKEALRHNYGRNRSQEFYDECSYRLSLTRRQLVGADDEDVDELDLYSDDLSQLSGLITRIERSHLGEFSWPFADFLSLMGRAIGRGARGSDPSYEAPIFAISADGGLEAYSIKPEQNQVPHNAKRRIFNIVFPRTLKHHVLLHPILAHELGHAAGAVPSMQAALERNVLRNLTADSPLADADRFEAWKNSWQSETKIEVDSQLETEKQILYWREEFLCDLVGLLLFGPSFIAAHRALLSAIDPRGVKLGEEHPPNVSRFDLLDKAVDILGWKKTDFKLHKRARQDVDRFWKEFKKVTPRGPKDLTSFFDDKKVADAVQALSAILKPLEPAPYRPASADTFARLLDMLYNSIPPVGAELAENGVPSLCPVDMRSVLYAGWVAWISWPEDKNKKRPSFLVVNKLCDRAILQQMAIDIWRLAPKKEKEDGGAFKKRARSATSK